MRFMETESDRSGALVFEVNSTDAFLTLTLVQSQILLVGLKLGGVISWPWLVIALPALLPFLAALVGLIIAGRDSPPAASPFDDRAEL